MSDVRGAGLFVGIEFVGAGWEPDPVAALRVVNAMRERGALFSATGYFGNTLKIPPPLVIGGAMSTRLSGSWQGCWGSGSADALAVERYFGPWARMSAALVSSTLSVAVKNFLNTTCICSTTSMWLCRTSTMLSSPPTAFAANMSRSSVQGTI